MKQVLQDLRSGATYVENVPCPSVTDGHLLIRTSQTLVSVGTEKMLVEFGKANLLDKARQQPDKVRMVIDKIRTDGLVPTLEAVRAKLDQPIPMGYCNVGEVVQCGKGVSGFSVGDRVVSNGNHAEMVVVPTHLCARIPASVSDDRACFTVMGAIALQGIRLIKPELGETFTVIGLGLVGLLTVQLLRANGCRVLGIDFNPERASLARQFGADTIVLREGIDPVQFALSCTNGVGVDGVLITASTRSHDPIHQAANMCRKRGRIVLVGVVGLELSRADFYEKELSFQVSCSYGPGRYDPVYEQKGHDYPIGFVRWTEQRNFGAVLNAMAAGSLTPELLITTRRSLEQAEEAYADIAGPDTLGVVLECDLRQDATALNTTSVKMDRAIAPVVPAINDISVAMIGAGNYASRVLVPAFQKAGAVLSVIACQNGASGIHVARKYGFNEVTTESSTLCARDDISLVAVATRHDSHARFVNQALLAGKHVFVEKPLAISHAELLSVEQSYLSSRQHPALPQVMIGFNRRFSSLIAPIKSVLATDQQPACINMMINAGEIPAGSWIQDSAMGGGRIIGEVCHFVDLALYLASSSIVDFGIQALGNSSFTGIASDKCSIYIKFANGSLANIQYWSNGHSAFPKERIEVFWNGSIYQIDNFRKLRIYGGATKSKSLLWQDKGNSACVAAYINALRTGKSSPIPFEDIMQVSQCVIDLAAMVD